MWVLCLPASTGIPGEREPALRRTGESWLSATATQSPRIADPRLTRPARLAHRACGTSGINPHDAATMTAGWLT